MPKSWQPRSLSVARQNGARTNKRALPRCAGNAREKRRKLGHLTRRHSTHRFVPLRTALRRDATRRYGIFAERLFLIDAIQTSRPAVRPPVALVKLFVTFRAASREFEVPASADPSLSSRKNTRWGHSWDASSFLGTVSLSGIMPVLRRVTLSS